MYGYLVCRVPTVAPVTTSGEATNPQVVPTLWRPAQLLTFCLVVEATTFISTSLIVQGPEKTFSKKRAAHSGPLGGIARGLGMIIT
jgi:hypothetical protein